MHPHPPARPRPVAPRWSVTVAGWGWARGVCPPRPPSRPQVAPQTNRRGSCPAFGGKGVGRGSTGTQAAALASGLSPWAAWARASSQTHYSVSFSVGNWRPSGRGSSGGGPGPAPGCLSLPRLHSQALCPVRPAQRSSCPCLLRSGPHPIPFPSRQAPRVRDSERGAVSTEQKPRIPLASPVLFLLQPQLYREAGPRGARAARGRRVPERGRAPWPLCPTASYLGVVFRDSSRQRTQILPQSRN